MMPRMDQTPGRGKPGLRTAQTRLLRARARVGQHTWGGEGLAMQVVVDTQFEEDRRPAPAAGRRAVVLLYAVASGWWLEREPEEVPPPLRGRGAPARPTRWHRQPPKIFASGGVNVATTFPVHYGQMPARRSDLPEAIHATGEVTEYLRATERNLDRNGAEWEAPRACRSAIPGGSDARTWSRNPGQSRGTCTNREDD